MKTSDTYNLYQSQIVSKTERTTLQQLHASFTEDDLVNKVKSILGENYQVKVSSWTINTCKLSIDWDRFFDRICGNGWMWGNSEFIEFNAIHMNPVRISGTMYEVILALRCFPGYSDCSKDDALKLDI